MKKRKILRLNSTPPSSSSRPPKNHDAYDLLTAPENSTLPDDYGIEDGNEDFFS